MFISERKGKEIHLPAKLFMLNKNAVYALPFAALIVVLFPILVRSDLSISLYLFIPLSFFWGSTKILVTRDFVIIIMIMLLGLVIMAYSYGKEPLITVPTIPAGIGILSGDMFLSSIVYFFVYLVGYFYSFVVKNPFKILRYIFLYGWALVTIYFIVVHGFFIGNSLMMGNITIILLPYMYLVFTGKQKTGFVFSLIILWYLMLILCRTAFMAGVIFFLTYYLYPYLIVNKRRYKLYFWSFMIVLFLLIALYLLAIGFTSDSSLIPGFELLDDLSKKLFGGKYLGRGRDIIWSELLLYIKDKPLFGYGINQDSGFFQSTAAILGFRGLDSHNIYFEMLVRGGVLLLSFFVILFYKIWGTFYSINNNKMSRIGASGFLAFLFLGAGLPIGLTGNIVLNTLLWFYWGVASGNTWIKNHQMRPLNHSPNIAGTFYKNTNNYFNPIEDLKS